MYFSPLVLQNRRRKQKKAGGGAKGKGKSGGREEEKHPVKVTGLKSTLPRKNRLNHGEK